MGVVWEARDETLDRLVAVKEVVPPSRLNEAERSQAQERLLREARAAAGVVSVASVAVYDAFAEDQRSWIVMELLEGPTLADVVRDSGPLSVAETVTIGQSLVDALEVAHRAGVLHRDVKPTNVLLTERGAVLTDFGIAHREGDPGITTTGAVIGSPSYLAPERARGEPAGRPADLWSLGATLFAALEGRGPFDREGQLAALHAVVNEPVPEPQRAGVLAPLLMHLLSKDPAERPTVDETRELLSRAGRGLPPGTVPLPVVGGAAAAGLDPPAPTTDAPQPAGAAPAQSMEPDAGSEELPRPAQPPLRRRRRGNKLAVGGALLLLAAVVVLALATLLPDGGLPDPGGPDNDATDVATASPDATSSDSVDPSASPTDDPTDVPDDGSSAPAPTVPDPFESRDLYEFARYLFDPQDCFVPSPGEFPVSEIEPDLESVKCISDSAPYTGTFWCKSDLEGLLADRDVYLARAIDGTQPVTGPPAGQDSPADGIQVSFNHVASEGGRVYWDSEEQLCAGELQAAGSDDLDDIVSYWLDGRA